MKIYENSFTWKFLTLNKWFKLEQEGLNFCKVFWLGVFMYFLYSVIIFAGVGTVSTLAYFINDVRPPNQIGLPFILVVVGIMVIGFACIAAVVLAFFAIMYCIFLTIGGLANCIKKARGKNPTPIISDNVKEAYSGWKNKYCPTVTIVNEQEVQDENS